MGRVLCSWLGRHHWDASFFIPPKVTHLCWNALEGSPTTMILGGQIFEASHLARKMDQPWHTPPFWISPWKWLSRGNGIMVARQSIQQQRGGWSIFPTTSCHLPQRNNRLLTWLLATSSINRGESKLFLYLCFVNRHIHKPLVSPTLLVKFSWRSFLVRGAATKTLAVWPSVWSSRNAVFNSSVWQVTHPTQKGMSKNQDHYELIKAIPY